MSAERYFNYLLGGEALPAANAIIIPPYEKSKEWSGVWAHEYFHFLQLSGTPMGQLISFQKACVGHFVGAFLREPPAELKKTPNWLFPILLWANITDDNHIKRSLQKHFGFLLFVAETINLHFGTSPSICVGNQWRRHLPWPWATLPPNDRIYPDIVLTSDKDRGILTTLTVMESAAAIQGLRMEGAEINIENAQGFALSEQQRNRLITAPRLYNLALLYVEENSSIPNKYAPSVTVLAADLALESGIRELEMSKQGQPVEWEDWYPGWRFIKAVKIIDDLFTAQKWWPETEDELINYQKEIRQKCNWTEPEHCPSALLSVSPDRRFASDKARHRLAEAAMILRMTKAGLWSIGSRNQLVDASLNWFKPPIIKEYGQNKIKSTRSDWPASDVQELWEDAQLEHIAWQLLGASRLEKREHRIECFPWAKERSGSNCEYYNGKCRWFPEDAERQVPDKCPMMRILIRLCGNYWSRLRPAF